MYPEEINEDDYEAGAGNIADLACDKASDETAFSTSKVREREFFIDNLLVRIHFVIVMMRWTGLASVTASDETAVKVNFKPCRFHL